MTRRAVNSAQSIFIQTFCGSNPRSDSKCWLLVRMLVWAYKSCVRVLAPRALCQALSSRWWLIECQIVPLALIVLPVVARAHPA